MTSVTQNPRKTMLTNLTTDLTAAGWDQPCRMYFVIGEPDDEYVEYVGAFGMDPTHFLMHRADEGTLKEHVVGIVVTFESYTYPHELNKRFSSNRVSHGYRALIGPSEHPAHVELRTLIMAMRDGTVMRAEHYTDNLDRVRAYEMDPRPIPGQTTGDETVDYMRNMLGIVAVESRPHSLPQAIAMDPELQKLMFESQREGWSSEKIGAALFRGVNSDVQRDMLTTMPDDVRKLLTDEGFDFDALTAPTFEEVNDDPGTPGT